MTTDESTPLPPSEPEERPARPARSKKKTPPAQADQAHEAIENVANVTDAVAGEPVATDATPAQDKPTSGDAEVLVAGKIRLDVAGHRNWMDPYHNIESAINTRGENNRRFRRGGVNANGKFKNSSSELAIDLDYVNFTIKGDQQYQTQLSAPGSDIELTKGNIPAKLQIFTAKADYTKRFKKFVLETGLKTAMNKTDNLAEYY